MSKISKFILGTTVGLMLTGSALAGGYTEVAPVSNFQGFYAGATIGGTTWDPIWTDRDAWLDNFGTDFSLGTVHNRFSGFSGGIELGYNWQPGNVVYGLEADWTWADLSKTKTYSPTTTGTSTLTLFNKLRSYGSLRARAGLVVNDLLLYLTAGVGAADINHQWTAVNTGTPATEQFRLNRTRWGTAAGAGLAWALSPRLMFKVEGLGFSFPNRTVTVFSPTAAQTVHFDNIDTFWTGRVGLDFKI